MVAVGETKPFGVYEVELRYEDSNTGRSVMEHCAGHPQSVAAWMRAVAQRLDPPSLSNLRPPGTR